MNRDNELQTVTMKPVPRQPATIVVGTRRDPGFLIPPPPPSCMDDMQTLDDEYGPGFEPNWDKS